MLTLAAVAAGALAGCSTTQQEAARLQLNSARIRAGEATTRVTTPGAAVRVTRVAVVSAGGRTAFVVQIRNRGTKPVSDLPISVGVRQGNGRPVYVNSRSQLEFSYFDAHLPAVAAGRTLTWVYTTAGRLPAGGRPFAIVGGTPSPPAPAERLPVIRAAARRAGPSPAARAATSQLTIELYNSSRIPQYQLQVYAFAMRSGRYVAAGNLTVPHLGTETSRTLKLGLLGSFAHARLQVEALPTIFQ